MKRILFLIAFTITTLIINAQSGCNVFITSNFESQCVLTTEKDDALKENEGLMLACKESQVEYYATTSFNVTTYNWAVIGASSYTIINNGAGVRVNWSNGNTGQIKVQVITQDGSICEATRFITLIEKPQIASSSIPNYKWENGVKVIEICLGETVTFINESSTSNTDIVGHFWETSTYGNASSENYTIENIMQETSVLHKVVNNCGCEDEEKYEIRILEGQKLELSCYGTVCEGAEVTYEVLNSNCNQYNWFVEGGIIKSGQGNPKITIEWGNPQSGYGILGLDGSLCGEGYCPKPLSVKIPIITNNVEISGQTTACVGDAVVYSLPLWGSTEYTWTITPQQGVYQSYYENANETLLAFNSPGTYQLNVTYKCDFLECGPFTSQTKTITVKEKLEIENERDNICLGQSTTFTLNNNTILATWRVYNANNQQIYTAQINTLVYTPTQAGKYRITAEHSNYCNVAEFNINVKNPPPAPSGNTISGKHYVCPNASVLLKGTPESPFYSLVWKSLCSTPEVEGIGNEFTIQYFGIPCDVEVYHYDKEVGCLSTTPFNFTLQDFNLSPTTLPTSGITACVGSTIDYNNEVPNQSPEVLYEWEVSPAYAATVIGDKTSNNTSILVNHSNLSSFNIILKRKYCTDLVNTITIPVTIVSPPPAPTITPNPIPSVCANTLFSLTGNGAITNNSSDFSWSIDNGAREYNGVRSITHYFSESGTHNIELSYQPYSVCPASKINTTINILPLPRFTLHDNDNNSVSVSSHDGGNYTSYSWTINGVQSINTTSTLTGVQEGDQISCTVTNSAGCSSTEFITLNVAPGNNNPPCIPFYINYTETICLDQSITVHATNPTQNSVNWNVYPNVSYRINSLDNDNATITFTEPGTYYITGYTYDGTNCYKSNTISITVPVILDFDVEYSCVSPIGIKITDKSKYYPSVLTRTFTISGLPSLTMSPTERIKTQPAALPTTPTQHTITLSYGGCTLQKTITLYPQTTGATITSTYNNNACENVPTTLTVNLNPATSAVKNCDWNFGDGSTNTSTTNNIDHTFPMGINPNAQYNYNVSAVVTDGNNCSVTTPTIMISLHGNNLKNPNKLQFPLNDQGIVCPGIQRQILYNPNITIPSSSTYLWHLTLPTNNANTYQTYKTDDYYVRVTSSIGCIGEAMINVPFKNKPFAFISCNNDYCLNDEIELLGDAGSANLTYSWNVVAPDYSSQQFTTPNVSFVATKVGSYSIYLTVDNGECSDTYTKTVNVSSLADAPTIYYAGNQCIHEPPVVLGANALNGEPIHWSNGVSNSTAHYYSPGVAIAYYYDQNGCKSKEAEIIIPSAPNFDALLTGCYKRCKIDLPNSLNVYGISKDSINWHWLLNQTQIANGFDSINLTLPLIGFGTYNLDVLYNYNNNNYICNTVSPNLVIEEEECPCDNLEIKKIVEQQSIEECRIIYTVDIDICNNGNEACLDKLISNPDGIPDEINILNIDNFPLNLGPGECNTIKLTFEVLSPLTSSASFRIFDACNGCYIDFSIDINVEILDCEEEMILEYVELYPDFSSQTMAYFKFGIHFPNNPQAIFRVWSEPSQVLNYNFDQGGARIDGLAMFDRNLLEQMAERGEKVCFHVLMCKDNAIRECVICIGAKELLNIIIENGSKSSPIQKENKEEGKANSLQTNSPYLVPNPASTYVKVEGIEQDNISEILLIDMQGKNIQKVSETNILDIQEAFKGTYIVRVISKDSKVYYLKLIKN